jgi:hypothetical protein
MAMTKAEKAAFDLIVKQLDEARAMRFRDFVLHRLVPSDLNQTGWNFDAYSRKVNQGCFRAGAHSYSRTDRTDAQGTGGPWYASKADAYRALRLALQQEYAEILAILDRKIDNAVFNIDNLGDQDER